MQGPYATDPGEEIARLHRVVIRAERLGHQGNILELSLSIHQHEKGQMQYNQIKEVNKATHVGSSFEFPENNRWALPIWCRLIDR